MEPPSSSSFYQLRATYPAEPLRPSVRCAGSTSSKGAGRSRPTGTRKPYVRGLVKTFVPTSPIRRATPTASSCDHAESKPAPKKIAPLTTSERSNRSLSHGTRFAVSADPPPSESRLNSNASQYTIRSDPPSADCGAPGADSIAGLSFQYRISTVKLKSAYPTKILWRRGRCDQSADQSPGRIAACSRQPSPARRSPDRTATIFWLANRQSSGVHVDDERDIHPPTNAF
jgi:hypothetical protein